jgi:protein arginine kinase
VRADVLNELAKQPTPWLQASSSGEHIAVSSRVRLARNLAGCPFPNRADEVSREAVLNVVLEQLTKSTAFHPEFVVTMDALSAADRDVLLERHLVSRELCSCGKGSGLAVCGNESPSVMINEEDHLRLQAMCAGFDVRQAWQQASRLDAALSECLDFAFDSGLGFLTACPTNVGTGLRASVMLHLPALTILGMTTPIANASLRLGMTVRGILGEGTEAIGSLFQLSNQSTLGESEEEIIDRLESIIRRIVVEEQNARMRLARRERARLYDFVGRSYGILRHAYSLSSKEALDNLSGLQLGVEMGLISVISVDEIRDLMLAVQPGHMQLRLGQELAPEERDRVRAGMVRDRLC